MSWKILNLSIILLALSLVLFACGPKETEPASTTQPAGNEIKPASTEETSYEGLGLTEDEIRMLEERGVANVDSVEVASKIAGFGVMVPSYVPEGFQPGKFMINISGAGLPPELKPKFNRTNVQIVYTYQDDRDIVILLLQATHKSGIGDAGIRESVDICGSKGESIFVKANPDEGRPYDRLILSWEKDGVYYSLTGTLSGTLDEAELEKMACSIGAELEKITY